MVVHEFGHFYFAKKSGILVREFAIGMGPKIFAHIGKDGTAYTIRILPLGGYVRMAGWGDDTTEIKTGTPVSLTLTDDGKVKRINLSGKKLDQTALPMQVTQFDFEDKLFIKGLVLEEEKTFAVDHDATVVEADGTEVRIAPLDVQYQNATIWGKTHYQLCRTYEQLYLRGCCFLDFNLHAGWCQRCRYQPVPYYAPRGLG